MASIKLAHIDGDELAKAKAAMPKKRQPPAVAKKAAPTKAYVPEEEWKRMMQPPEEPTGSTTAAAASAAAAAEPAPAAKTAAPTFADLPEDVRRQLRACPPPKEVGFTPAAKKAPPKLQAPKTVPTRITGNSPAPIEWTPLMPDLGEPHDADCGRLSVNLVYLARHRHDLSDERGMLTESSLREGLIKKLPEWDKIRLALPNFSLIVDGTRKGQTYCKTAGTHPLRISVPVLSWVCGPSLVTLVEHHWTFRHSSTGSK